MEKKSTHVARYAATTAADPDDRKSLIEALQCFAEIVDNDARNRGEFRPVDVQIFKNKKTGETIIEALIVSGIPTVKFIARISHFGTVEITGDYWELGEIVRAEFNDMPAFEQWAEGYAETEMELA